MAFTAGQWRTAPTEGYLHRQPYEAVPGQDASGFYGGGLPPTMTGPSSFGGGRYYDTGFDERSMAQAQVMSMENKTGLLEKSDAKGLDRGVLRSDATYARSLSAAHHGRAKHSKRSRQGPSFEYYSQWIADHAYRLWLWWGAGFAGIFAVMTAFVTTETVLSEEFQTFSLIAWESWFPSFMAIMLIITVLAVLGLAAAVMAVWIGWKESRPALRALFVSSAFLGLMVLCLAFFAWLYGIRARTYVIQAANLLCQEVQPFGCQPSNGNPAVTPADIAPAAAPPPGSGEAFLRRLARDGSAGSRVASAASAVLARFQNRGKASPLGAAVPGRRLDAAKSALAFGAAFNNNKDASDSSEFCRMLEQLCRPPSGFNAQTACVCSGVVRKDIREEPDSTDSGSSPEDVDTAQRRLQGSLFWQGDPVAPGPWEGTQGAYCAAWEPEGSKQGDWCFVSTLQECALSAKHEYTNKDAKAMASSTGPCSDEVESRSQFVLDGLGAMSWPLELSAVLGFILLALTGCGMLLYRSPSRPTVWHRTESKEVDGHPHENMSEEQSLKHRFEEAQREAVQRLNDNTPDDIKFVLYGFYKQAKEGDIHGDRPGFFYARERQKYDSWASHQGLSEAEAIEGYIKAVKRLGGSSEEQASPTLVSGPGKHH